MANIRAYTAVYALKEIAEDTAGFTGAELANILNEAAIIATRNKHTEITNEDIENAVKKIKKLFGELILGINYIQINETNIDNLISDIETPAFGFDKKLIVIKNAGLFKKGTKKNPEANSERQKKIAKYIEENINLINGSAILLFIE